MTGRRVLAALLLTAGLATPAAATHLIDLTTRYNPEILWFDAPNTTSIGQARVRIVFDGHVGAAALTPNQYWRYAGFYKAHMARLALRMPVSRAEPRARYAAFHDVARIYPLLRVSGFDLEDLDGGRLLPDL
ncbi:hypothetical protein MWU52_07765 [Jannaschia sp. S6380]|uniref:hypothetical protein n=1 Tax=Jannaschia sp. S6380 TaxID=2926408 RepID=UPI001FF631CE|nr:hypothetical protein [Jannaschia sp. S6380]MCK0167439.1 hypothetical protein [Jannaschia sp. S6380]